VSPPRAVIDSDIVWSVELLAEARRSLVEKKGLSEDVAVRWVGYPPQNFPMGRPTSPVDPPRR
jgi:hypothetical protein